jgi:Spy/CpxP family protein refolding chaperone
MKVSKNPTSRHVIRCAAALTLLFVCAAPALAQRGKWWQDDRFRKELGLTDEQSTRLEAIFQKMQPNLRERMRALDQAEDQLEQLIETGDDATVMQHVGVVEAQRAELNKSRTMMLLRMRRALTADQWAKFTALADERNQRNRDRTPNRQQQQQQQR